MFYFDFSEIFKSTFITEHLRVTASNPGKIGEEALTIQNQLLIDVFQNRRS